MLGSSALEIIISLAFIYFLMSLICSVGAQLASAFFQLRSANLYQGLCTLLHDPNGKEFVDDVFKHYAITSLTKKKWFHGIFFAVCWLLGFPFRVLFSIPCGACRPQYIPPKSLSRAVAETVREKQVLIEEHHAAETLLTQKPKPWDLIPSLIKSPIPPMEQTPVHSSQPDPTVDGEGERIPFDSDQEIQPNPDPQTAREVYPNDVMNIPQDPIATWVEASMPAIEKWFEGSVPLLRDWYKFWMRGIIFFFAIVLTVAINADTLMIANELRGEELNRAQAEANDQPYIPSLEKLEKLFGWSSTPGPHAVPQDFETWVLKIVGLLITALAVAQGSPFWFDLFRRLVDSRTATHTS